MRKVAIVSWAVSEFARDSARSVFDLACGPCTQILKSHLVDKDDLDAVMLASCTSEQYAATIISEMLGIKPRVSQRIDNLCNSGTNAIATAYSLIASEMCDLALVTGAEKADSAGNRLYWDVTRGSFMFPVHWAALFANAHMRKYGTTEEQLASIAVKNRRAGSRNPNALFKNPVTIEEVMSSRVIAEPLKLLDCSASCDGAAAVLLASDSKAREISDHPIWIKGIGQRTTSASFANTTRDLTTIEAAKLAGRDAFKTAGVQPSSIDVAEVHDAFTILELLALEDLGFKRPGERNANGSVAVNPRGGILASGHPVGATGVAQVAEIAAQLSRKAGNTQVKDCNLGLVHNLAAAGSSATVIIIGA